MFYTNETADQAVVKRGSNDDYVVDMQLTFETEQQAELFLATMGFRKTVSDGCTPEETQALVDAIRKATKLFNSDDRIFRTKTDRRKRGWSYA